MRAGRTNEEQLRSVEKHFQERSAELQIPPLRYPGFPVDVGGVDRSHAPFFKRKAHTRLCPVLRGRKSGFASVGMTRGGRSFHGERLLDGGRFSSPWAGCRPMTPLVMIVIFGLLVPCGAQSVAERANGSAERTRWAVEAGNVKIVRDDWGIAHVYGKTDADAVFGMIYAQAEDDFNRI